MFLHFYIIYYLYSLWMQVDIDMVDADDVFSLRAVSDGGGQTVRSADGLSLLIFIPFIIKLH